VGRGERQRRVLHLRRILIGFGFSFLQTLSLIIIGNLSYFLLGLASLQGPDAGTTVFGINRAAFGPNGNRVIAFFTG